MAGESSGAARHGTHTLKILLDLARQGGLSEADCLRGTDLVPSLIDDPDAEVDVRQEFTVVRNLLAALGTQHPCGLIVGGHHHLTTFGLLGFAQASSPTFRSAVDLVVRYLELTPMFSRIHAEEGNGEWRMVIDDSALPDDVRRTIVEAESVAILNMETELFGIRMPVRRLHFRFPDPGYAEDYRQIFGVIPEFGQPRNFLALDASCLDQPMPQASPLTAQFCEARCQELLNAKRARRGVAGRVRDLLLKRQTRIPAEQEVAESLHVSPRTLQRQLAAEGVSFRLLREEVREALAVELLKTPQLTIKAVADRLGYAEPSAFVRAFKRWRGEPPTAYRHGRTPVNGVRRATDPCAETEQA